MKNIFTEKENSLFNELQIFKFKKMYLNKSNVFYDISESTNFYIHVNSRNDFDWKWNYGNAATKEIFNYSNAKEVEYKQVIDISDTQIVKNYLPKLKKYNMISDEDAIFNYLQRMKVNDKWSWIITNKIILDNKKYLNYSYNLEDLGNAGLFLNNKLENTFSDINAWQKFQSLTKREKEILKHLANGNSTKEITEIYYVSENTVKKHRENINRKIDCNKIHDLIRFADAFQLIGEL